MGTFDPNNSTYTKEILEKQLILSKPLTKNEVEELNLANNNLKNEEDNFLPKQWFCRADIGEWEDVEIFIQGDDKKPYVSCIDLAEKTLKDIPQHINRALNYLKEFFPAQQPEDYYLSAISFGRMINFDDQLYTGFTIGFYSEKPHEYQYKVKFKENGWPIGFEGGPM
ncbi:hypothetical protein [Psychrobacillus sp. MER TA 171]|uniref:hypothetical protein n=1 Tax=Psychrobacillus sp. MER TA 171 TaxID=2939577 RepID=UPI00203D5BEC|nr:hypothetical protein [Psychrobacillus sp. MER TA 171]MCM3357702.1 hypothetical protein [Psychrobacillus sp. MER TA 171]